MQGSCTVGNEGRPRRASRATALASARDPRRTMKPVFGIMVCIMMWFLVAPWAEWRAGARTNAVGVIRRSGWCRRAADRA